MKFLFLIFILPLVLIANESAQRLPRPQACGNFLNEIGNRTGYGSFRFPWLPSAPPDAIHGWVKLHLTGFDLLLRAHRIDENTIDNVKAWIGHLRTQNPHTVEEVNQPDVLTSRIAATFQKINFKNRVLYAMIVPAPYADEFPVGAQAVHCYAANNFGFFADYDCKKQPAREWLGRKLERPYELLLLAPPPRGTRQADWATWIADFLAALSRWEDLDYLSRVINDGDPLRVDSLKRKVYYDGRSIRLNRGVFLPFIESRAQAVRAYVMKEMNFDDWETAWFEGQEKALGILLPQLSDEEWEVLTKMPNGIYHDLVIPLDHQLRNSFPARR